MLYNAYKAWCKHNGLTAMSGTMFGREMSKRYEKTRSGGKSIYRGIGLLEPSEVTQQAFPDAESYKGQVG